MAKNPVRTRTRTRLLAVGWGDEIGQCDNVYWVRAEGWKLLKRGEQLTQKAQRNNAVSYCYRYPIASAI